MSKNVKYISSKHFGAPQLLGDKWGYGVAMLRKCLCEGFNERTDVSHISVISEYEVKIIFASEHQYQDHQTIVISGTTIDDINTEYFITKAEPKILYVKPYDSLINYVGTKLIELSTVSSKVSPLGFIEKFRDGDRSVFTTDENEAFLYIDEREPASWPKTNANRWPIEPLVYMTDRMDDINTPGKYIVPYDSTNPTAYNTYYKDGSYNRNGIWCFTMFGVLATSGNNAANQLIPMDYVIIGNGRLFYYIPVVPYTSTSYPVIHIFGKINNEQQSSRNKNYILFARNTITGRDAFEYPKMAPAYINTPNNIDTQSSAKSHDLGTSNCSFLYRDGKSKNTLFLPTKLPILQSSASSVNQSGGLGIKNSAYPEPATYKYYISTIYINDTVSYAGKLSGLKWVYNADNILHKDRTIYKYKISDGSYKYLYVHKGESLTTTSSTGIVVYNISLDNKDWHNYD